MEKTKGIIESINSKPWNNTTLWKIVINGKEYGYFSKEFNYSIGDEITFNYEEKGQYLSIKEILDNKSLSQIPSKKDLEGLQSIFLMDTSMIKVTMLKCAVDLCLKRNTLSDEEIWAQYERFLNMLKPISLEEQRDYD